MGPERSRRGSGGVSGVKKNILYSVALAVANYVFPFITYPYVSRVLGVTTIGICNFIDSVINYFILFSMLGISTVGIREIARCGGDREKRSRVFSTLLLINGICTLVALAVLIVLTFTVPKLAQYSQLCYVGAVKLVFNFLLVEWLYQGMEDFRFITTRSVLVKTLYVAAVFLLVREADDYTVYYVLSAAIIVLNAAINFVFSRRFVRISFRKPDMRLFWKPVLILGVYALLVSMYTTFNVAFLGFACTETDVGYYSSATKLFYIVLSLYTAFTNVLLPRMTSLLSEGDMAGFSRFLGKSRSVLLSFSFPLVVWSVIFAPAIIRLVSGPGYEGAIGPMRLIMPLLFVIGYEQILVLQILLPAGKDRRILVNSAIAALLAVLLNVLLVPTLRSVGSACVWMAAECLTLVLSQLAVRPVVAFRFPFAQVGRYLLAYLPCVLGLVLLARLPLSFGPAFLLSAAGVGLYAAVLELFVFKNEIYRTWLAARIHA